MAEREYLRTFEPKPCPRWCSSSMEGRSCAWRLARGGEVMRTHQRTIGLIEITSTEYPPTEESYGGSATRPKAQRGLGRVGDMDSYGLLSLMSDAQVAAALLRKAEKEHDKHHTRRT